jgi:hypothetical protein
MDNTINIDTTKGTACELATQLASQGWHVLGCDEPKEAVMGLCVFHYRRQDTGEHVDQEELPELRPEGAKEEALWLRWPLFDKPLKPEHVEVEPAELLKRLKAGERLCDDPRRRLLGVVEYLPSDGRAIVREVPLTRIREFDQCQELQAIREPLLKKRGKITASAELATAISGAGKARAEAP